MTIEEQKVEGYITLKEAGELFGYAPDYVGQLIRKGKISGKQVYANVAWMTTVQAMNEYIAKEKNRTQAQVSLSPDSMLEKIGNYLFSERRTRILLWTFRISVIFLVIFSLIIFYFLSISIDRSSVRAAERRLQSERVLFDIDSERLAKSNTTYE